LREPLYQDHRELRLAPRLGISVYPDDAREPDALLRSAYTAVFKSRIDGTEPLCLYSAELGQAVAVRSELEQALAQALDRDEFIIHYQPQVSASTGAVVGLEALLRWRNPRLGWVEPEAFIPVAEHMGLIQALGAWTLEAACRQLHAWELVGFGPLRLSVNLSPLQFGAVDLVTEISAAVERSGIAPSSLELEITESTLMRDIAAAARAMNSLRSRGVAVAIDDFGTGYSSLASLRDFPLDRLKIDRAFVREIGSNRDATEIALAVIAMGKRLGLQVVAEGVERAAQARFLELNGCDELQGYYFSRPLPPEDFEALLRVGVGWTPTPSRRP
jgi:EAL domain-containing protein (putative c-di-GMP-specific phosphodiesterase class I)